MRREAQYSKIMQDPCRQDLQMAGLQASAKMLASLFLLLFLPIFGQCSLGANNINNSNGKVHEQLANIYSIGIPSRLDPNYRQPVG
jgi:hypothetical protein